MSTTNRCPVGAKRGSSCRHWY